MAGRSRPKGEKVRGNSTKAQFAPGLADIVLETVRLWRKHHPDMTRPNTLSSRHAGV